jgi:hypothetical protein
MRNPDFESFRFLTPKGAVTGRQRNQHVAIDAVFELMEIRPQSERAFELAKGDSNSSPHGARECPASALSSVMVSCQSCLFTRLLSAFKKESPHCFLKISLAFSE